MGDKGLNRLVARTPQEFRMAISGRNWMDYVDRLATGIDPAFAEAVKNSLGRREIVNADGSTLSTQRGVVNTVRARVRPSVEENIPIVNPALGNMYLAFAMIDDSNDWYYAFLPLDNLATGTVTVMPLDSDPGEPEHFLDEYGGTPYLGMFMEDPIDTPFGEAYELFGIMSRTDEMSTVDTLDSTDFDSDADTYDVTAHRKSRIETPGGDPVTSWNEYIIHTYVDYPSSINSNTLTTDYTVDNGTYTFHFSADGWHTKTIENATSTEVWNQTIYTPQTGHYNETGDQVWLNGGWYMDSSTYGYSRVQGVLDKLHEFSFNATMGPDYFDVVDWLPGQKTQSRPWSMGYFSTSSLGLPQLYRLQSNASQLDTYYLPYSSKTGDLDSGIYINFNGTERLIASYSALSYSASSSWQNYYQYPTEGSNIYIHHTSITGNDTTDGEHIYTAIINGVPSHRSFDIFDSYYVTINGTSYQLASSRRFRLFVVGV